MDIESGIESEMLLDFDVSKSFVVQGNMVCEKETYLPVLVDLVPVKAKETPVQYFTIVPDNLSLVYRLAYQTTLGGTVPFYYQSQIITSLLTGATSEGLGGASTIRGILRNRVIAMDYGLAADKQDGKPGFYMGLNYLF